MTVYKYIFDLLEQSGFNVFAPNTHKGECRENYLVLKETNTGRYNNYSTQIVLYDIMCYAKNYTACLALKEKVRKTMLQARYSVMPTGNETPAFFDDSVKGYMASIEYRNYRKDL